MQEGSACGVSSVATGFTVSDTSGILLKLGQEGISMIVAGSNHKLIPAAKMQPFWQQALQTRAAQKRTAFSGQTLTKQVQFFTPFTHLFTHLTLLFTQLFAYLTCHITHFTSTQASAIK